MNTESYLMYSIPYLTAIVMASLRFVTAISAIPTLPMDRAPKEAP